MKNLSKRDLYQFISIFCVFLFCGASAYDAQNVTNFIAAWPEIPTTTIRLAYTIPQMISGVMMMVTGAIVGKYISYRFACIGGSLLIAFGGLTSFFFAPSWTVVLIFRAIMGLGLGLYGGRTALLALTTPKEEYAKLFGYCNAAMKGSAIVMPIIVGYLAKISWQHPFLINIVPLFTAIVMFFWMKEPEKSDSSLNSTEKINRAERGKIHIPYQIWGVLLVIFVWSFAKYGSWAEYAKVNELGDSVIAGYAQSLQNYAGLMVVLFFGPITKKLGKYTLWVAYLGVICTFLAMILFKSPILVLVGAFLWGSFYTLHFTTQQIISTNVADENSKAICSSLILGAPLFFNFLSTGAAEFYHKVFKLSNLVESSMVGSMICYGVCFALCLVFGLTKFTEPKKEA